jgi:hypothetical protein
MESALVTSNGVEGANGSTTRASKYLPYCVRYERVRVTRFEISKFVFHCYDLASSESGESKSLLVVERFVLLVIELQSIGSNDTSTNNLKNRGTKTSRDICAKPNLFELAYVE